MFYDVRVDYVCYEDGEGNPLGLAHDVEAETADEAKKKAIDLLYDDRLDAVSCMPVARVIGRGRKSPRDAKEVRS